MLKKLMRPLLVLACLALAAPTVSAAETFRARVSEVGIFAGFTNIPDGDWESLPPGDYFSTWVFAGKRLATGTGPYEENGVCVFSETFTVDTQGQFNWTFGVKACDRADTIEVDRRLQTGRLVASLPITDCAAWDEETGECLEPIELGVLDIDLSFSGAGDVQRYRSIWTSGVAGLYTAVYHGTGAAREAIPAGTVALDGVSIIEGATSASAQLVRTSSGSVEVAIGG